MKKISEKGRKYVNILGINVNSTSKEELLTSLEDKISHNSKFYVVTPNPEHVLASLSNQKLKKALNDASFAIPDGTGLMFASIFLYGKGIKVIHGRSLFLDMVNLADKKGWKIFLLSGLDREAKLVAVKLKSEYKRLKIETAIGPVLDKNATPISETEKRVEKEAIEKINRFHPHFLFVAFGNPKQEIWIQKNISKLNIGGAMVVGGTFRYIAGLSKLPPDWMDKLGIEWLWRLITEPYRFKRIFMAVVIFPLRVFWFKITGR